MNKKIPEFKNEDEERDFWATESPLDYFDTGTARRAIFPNLKPALRSISLRLPVDMIEQLKIIANRQDILYQSLIKTYIKREITTERQSLSRSTRILRKTTKTKMFSK